MRHRILDVVHFNITTAILIPCRWYFIYAQHCRASEYVESHFVLRDFEFHRCQHPLYINFMASALEQAVTDIQLNDYVTRMLIELGLSLHRSY